MNLKHIVLGVLITINSTFAGNINEKFFKALHQVESSGRTGRVIGDHGRALGPLQIHREYFNDAAEYDKSLGNNYNRVTDLEFAKRVVSAYLNRYAPKAVAKNDFKTLARVHNGGPNGHKVAATVKYWSKIEQNLN